MGSTCHVGAHVAYGGTVPISTNGAATCQRYVTSAHAGLAHLNPLFHDFLKKINFKKYLKIKIKIQKIIKNSEIHIFICIAPFFTQIFSIESQISSSLISWNLKYKFK